MSRWESWWRFPMEVCESDGTRGSKSGLKKTKHAKTVIMTASQKEGSFKIWSHAGLGLQLPGEWNCPVYCQNRAQNHLGRTCLHPLCGRDGFFIFYMIFAFCQVVLQQAGKWFRKWWLFLMKMGPSTNQQVFYHFVRIGPLALCPCALLRACGFRHIPSITWKICGVDRRSVAKGIQPHMYIAG